MTVVKVKGAKDVVRKIRQLGKELGDMGSSMKQVSVFLDRWVKENFGTQGGKVGGWKKLKAGGRYAGKGTNRKFDPGANILRDTNRLNASFKPFFTKLNAGIGSELPYSKTHDQGTNKIPQRRILMRAAEVRKDVSKILDLFLKKIIKKVS